MSTATLRKRPKVATMSEKEITRAVFAHWAARKVPGSLMFSIPNAFAHGQAGLTRGVFDLGVMAPGLGAAYLELKTEKGRLSEAQKDFQTNCIRCNVRYAICFGLDEALTTLEQWGVLKPAAVSA